MLCRIHSFAMLWSCMAGSVALRLEKRRQANVADFSDLRFSGLPYGSVALWNVRRTKQAYVRVTGFKEEYRTDLPNIWLWYLAGILIRQFFYRLASTGIRVGGTLRRMLRDIAVEVAHLPEH